jgi:hypothetical protein
LSFDASGGTFIVPLGGPSLPVYSIGQRAPVAHLRPHKVSAGLVNRAVSAAAAAGCAAAAMFAPAAEADAAAAPDAASSMQPVVLCGEWHPSLSLIVTGGADGTVCVSRLRR